MNKIYGIVFKDNGKIYNFLGYNLDVTIDSKVIVETEKGLQIAKVVEIFEDSNTNINNLKSIIRIASKKDEDSHLGNLEAADKALKQARDIVQEMGLEMRLVDASYTFDRKQLLFNFLANERIDFRELVKKLASVYHTRIELRQIGVRDKAKEIGGIGQCGRELCCSSCVSNIDSITINMAKNQNIALNPNKINGACGRLLCCLTYEDDLYNENRNQLPQVGEIVNIKQGKGKVESIDILSKKYIVNINDEKYEIIVD